MLFRIVIKERGKTIEEQLVSLTSERHLQQLRWEIQDMYPPKYGDGVFFHPEGTLDKMHATGSFEQIPIEERKGNG
jgi:hypothetical protein